MAYETIENAVIANTTMRKYINKSGVFRTYLITPKEGYKLHDKALDGETEKGYTAGEVSCGYNYNFDENPREFYTQKEGESV